LLLILVVSCLTLVWRKSILKRNKTQVYRSKILVTRKRAVVSHS
jgi:hypothetical protein